MLIKSIAVGPLQTNCIIIADKESGKAMVIDPGDEPDRILDIVKENNLTVAYIVCTHGHFDHVGAIPELKEETGAPVVVHKDELVLYNGAKDMAAFWGSEIDPLPEPDILVKEGDVLTIGALRFEVMHSPGHSPGGICLYSEGLVITGDTLFAGSIGRTDFYGGDINKLKKSFQRLMTLPDTTRVLSGHGPETTIGHEKTGNMFSAEFLR
jgi:glyoxylase-like metal-dependent hydrolase (beta-lactamase superfamily II)